MSDEYDDDSEQETVAPDLAKQLAAAEKAQRALDRKLREAEEQLTAFREERIAARLDGVPSEISDLWKKANPGREPTEEEVAGLRAVLGPPTTEPIPDATASTTPTATYTPVPGGQAPGVTVQKMSQQEWSAINKRDPIEGVRLSNAGVVDWSDDTLKLSGTPTN